jgi:ornithine carbamoyltransferase
MKKDFLAVSDFSAAELQALLDSAVRLKREHREVRLYLIHYFL